MATVQIQVINPTASPVTVGTHTAPANTATTFGLDNTTTDAWGFLAAGCALAPASVLAEQREQAGFLLSVGQH